MTYVLKEPKWGWFLFLLGTIVISNILVYHTTFLAPLPKEVVLGSILDFIVVMPLLAYLFIIRKRYSIKHLAFVMLAGYGTAYLIIPNQHFQAYSFFPYMLLVFEGLFIAVELFVLYKLAVNFQKIMNTFKSNKSISYFYNNLTHAIDQHVGSNRLINILVSELSLFYYSLFSWEKQAPDVYGVHYTYHRNTSTIATYIMLIHATLLETIGFHFLLHSWSPILAWILLALNVYAILFFIGEIQAIRLSPIYLTNKSIHIQIGLMKRITIPLNLIQEVQHYNGPLKLKRRDRKDILEAVVRDLNNEKPDLEIILQKPIEANYMYGIKKRVKRILLNVDDKELFLRSVREKL